MMNRQTFLAIFSILPLFACVGALAQGGASLSDGDILVLTSNEQLVRLDQYSGATTVLAGGNSFVSEAGIAIDAFGRIYSVATDPATGSGRLLVFDPATRQQNVLTDGGLLVNPVSVAIHPASSDVFVACQSRIVRVNRLTGAQTLVADGGDIVNLRDLVFDSSGNLYVIDSMAFNTGEIWGAVFKVDTATGAVTTVSSLGHFLSAGGIATNASGDIYVYDDGGGRCLVVDPIPAKIIKVDPVTGSQSIITSGGLLRNRDFTKPCGTAGWQFPLTINFLPDGDIVALSLYTYSDSLLRIDPDTGAQSALMSGSDILDLRGFAVTPSGNIFAADTYGGLFSVDLSTGEATVESDTGVLRNARDVTVGPDGQVLVSSAGDILECTDFPGWISEVNPESGSVSLRVRSFGVRIPDVLASSEDSVFAFNSVPEVSYPCNYDWPASLVEVNLLEGYVEGIFVNCDEFQCFPGSYDPKKYFPNPVGMWPFDNGEFLLGDRGGSVFIPGSPEVESRLPNIYRATEAASQFSPVTPRNDWIVPTAIAVDDEGRVYGISEKAVFAMDLAGSAERRTIVTNEDWNLRDITIDQGGFLYLINSTFNHKQILRININSGRVKVLSSDGLLRNPSKIPADNDVTLYACDSGIDSHEPSVIAIDNESGSQTLVSSGGFLLYCNAIEIAGDDQLLVGDTLSALGPGILLRINAETGVQEVASSGGYLYSPHDLSIDSGGLIYLAEPWASIDSSQKPAIITVDPDTGIQAILTYEQFLERPESIQISPDGDVILADISTTVVAGGVIMIDAATGAQMLPWGPLLVEPSQIEAGPLGDIFVADRTLDSIFRIDPVSGRQETIAEIADLVDLSIAEDCNIISLSETSDELGQLYAAIYDVDPYQLTVASVASIVAGDSGPMALTLVPKSIIDSDIDGFDDCVEAALRSDRSSFDTDANGIADGVDTGIIRSLLDGYPDRVFDSAESRETVDKILAKAGKFVGKGKFGRATELLSEVRAGMDGCEAGEADNNDWLVECVAQDRARTVADLMMDNLR